MEFFKYLKIRFECLPVLLAALSFASALYPSSGDVVELTESNFNKLVVQSDDVWVVEFYAPWCGHCQQLVPEYSKAAKALKGVVKVGGVNSDKEKSLGGKYGVRGFPTIKIFAGNKASPEDYNGARTAQGLVDAALAAARSLVTSRLSGRSGGDGGSRSADPKDVIELTDSNFDSKVLKSDDMWLVEFFAPWCGHCKNLAPHWAEAASQLKGKVKLGALDATVHSLKAGEYQVKGYPTIKYFGPGAKDSSSAEDYTGGRTAQDIVTWALDKLAENVPPPEIKQIVDDKTLKAECEKPLCVVSVLPHILDCQASCRKAYLATLTKMGDKYKKKMWGWVWSEAGAQPEVESALDIGGFGYPAMAVLNAKKMKYSILRGSFSEEGINEFLRDLSYGKGSTAPMRGASLPTAATTPAWDGKDAELPQEEELDLSDISLDDEPQKDEL